jgi:hypothetical protein
MSVLDVIFNVFNYPVSINVAPAYSKAYAASHTVPFWLLLATFAILFGVVWIASGNINIFKDKKNKGARALFAIAVSFISLFGTPLAIWIMKVVYAFTVLTLIAVSILAGYILWTLTKGEWAKNAKANSDSSKILADASQKNAETARDKEKTNVYKEKTNLAASKGLHSQLREIRNLRAGLKNLLTDFNRIKTNNHFPVPANALSGPLRDLVKVNESIGKIHSFNTANDRVMSLMSTNAYNTTNTGTLTQLTPNPAGNNSIAALKAQVDTQTNDLGHSIGAIKETINAGIPNVQTLTNLMSWSESAINITNRMEKDVVLEKQLIEKL